MQSVMASLLSVCLVDMQGWQVTQCVNMPPDWQSTLLQFWLPRYLLTLPLVWAALHVKLVPLPEYSLRPTKPHRFVRQWEVLGIYIYNIGNVMCQCCLPAKPA